MLFRDGKVWRKISFGKGEEEFNLGDVLILRYLGDIYIGKFYYLLV